MTAIDWSGIIADAQVPVYRGVIRAAVAAGLPFAVGGSIAVAAYAHRTRPSKDIDLYVLPEDAAQFVALLEKMGMRDYYDEVPYDRGWIYRAKAGETIVDIIRGMANRRATVDRDWLTRGPLVTCVEEKIRLIPIEEMIWGKLYVLQHDRCDWPDVLNLVAANQTRIDWDRLRSRLEDDAPLLDAVQTVYRWLLLEGAGRDLISHRAALLDTRRWLLAPGESGEPGC